MDIYKKCGLRSILSTEALTHSKKIIFYLRAQNKKTKTDLPIDQDIFGQTRLRIVDFQKRIHDFPTVEIVAELVDASVALADHLQVVGLPFVPEQSPETRRIRLETANGETGTRNASAGANNRQIREAITRNRRTASRRKEWRTSRWRCWGRSRPARRPPARPCAAAGRRTSWIRSGNGSGKRSGARRRPLPVNTAAAARPLKPKRDRCRPCGD